MGSRKISRAGPRKVARTRPTSVKAASSRLPDPLLRAAREKNLVIFAGAGVSMLPPSSLPDWRQFNEILLDEAKSQELAAEVLDDNGKAAIASLTLEDVGITTFSEAIVKIIAGEMYFPALQTLDSDRTNANHQAMADLGRQGVLRAIVTTNFDTLIERAFTEAGVPLQIAVTEEAFSHPIVSRACTLYKIHGSVTDATTLVDTVGQKLRGLPSFVRFCLARLFATHHVLVVGYSGFDLEFGSDYLSFSSVRAAGPGLTWGVRAGTPPSERAAEVVGRAGARAALHEVKLPDLFYDLGARKFPLAETDESEDRRLAAERTRPHIAGLFANSGGRNSLALCMRLLADAGRTDGAALVRAALAADIGSQGNRLRINDGPAL
jgi:SIR2-like domain